MLVLRARPEPLLDSLAGGDAASLVLILVSGARYLRSTASHTPWLIGPSAVHGVESYGISFPLIILSLVFVGTDPGLVGTMNIERDMISSDSRAVEAAWISSHMYAAGGG